jgi:uncharacterized membrane-anchored protein
VALAERTRRRPMRRQMVAALIAVTSSLVGAGLAQAQSQPPTQSQPAQSQAPVMDFNPMTDPNVQKSVGEIELKFAYETAAKVARHGPVDIPLADEATLKLPAGYVFVPQKEGGYIMGALGNPIARTFLGLVTSEAGTDNWFIALDFNRAGYLRDGEAKSWSPDRLLKWLRNGAEASNKANLEKGLPAIEVKGWAEAPKYDAATHRLVWAAIADEKDAPADSDSTINYRTFALSRNGYLFLNLIANRNALEADKKHMEKILGGVTFNEGKRYQDFVEGRDKVAEFGLSALVASPSEGIGLLGESGGFLGKAGKLLILLGVGALIVVAWRFRSSRAA